MATGTDPAAGGSKVRRRVLTAAGVVVLLVIIAGAGLLKAALDHTKRYGVPSASMEPTIKVGGHVTVDLDAYKHTAPKRGDIVVFHPPAGADLDHCGNAHQPEGAACDTPTPGQSPVSFIKRIVAVGGDRLSLRSGVVYLDGRRQSEPYLARGGCDSGESTGCDLPRPIVVPAGTYFVL